MTIDVEQRLAAYRDMTLDRLIAQLPSREPRAFLYDLLRDYPERSGKGIRPALCIASCCAFGGTPDGALPIAVALELLHNAFLVHDDIEDESLIRRGLPTLHERHGVPLALNAGDAFVHHAYTSLLHNLPRTTLTRAILRELDVMVEQTIEGQALDLGWQRDGTVVGVEDYLRMTIKKTAWYTSISPLRLGAIVGSRGGANLDALFAYGAHLGAAFQIQNDLDDVEGDDAACDDLRSGKRTLPLLHLLGHADPGERELVLELIGRREELSGEDLRLVRKFMHAYGSVRFARSCMDGLARAACDAFDAGFDGVADSSDRRFLRDLIPYLFGRKATTDSA
jgi:geranylgeranyl diphosphate synthase, type II